MSKISLTPNASGTGTFSIASPNSNTNRTITLPDEAGELLVNTSSGIDVTGTVTADGLTVDGGSNGTIDFGDVTTAYGRLYADNTGTFVGSKTNQPLILRTNNSERMRIDSSGNVGIGTSSPTGKLAIASTGNTGSSLEAYSATDSIVPDFQLLKSGSGTIGTLSTTANGEKLGQIRFTGVDTGNNQRNGAKISVHQDSSATSGTVPASIRFDTTGAERMRIDSSGNVGIGTSSPVNNSGYGGLTLNGANGSILSLSDSGTEFSRFVGSATETSIQYGTSSVLTFRDGLSGGTERMRLSSGGVLALANTSLPTNGTAGVTLSPAGNVHCGTVGTAGADVMRFDNANGRVGAITIANSGTSYNSASDYRLKTDAQPMTGASARVQALHPVNFEWIVDGTRVDGFLAHEAQAVVPECATGTKDAMRDEEYEVTAAVLDDDGNETTPAVMGTRSVPDYQGIDQSKLVPLLTAALQEALTEITDLKARVIALESV